MMRKSVQTVLWCVIPLDISLLWTVWYCVYQQWGSDSVERGDHTTGPVQTRSCHTLSVINTIRTQQPGQMLSHYWTARLSAWPAEASFNGLGFGQFPGQAMHRPIPNNGPQKSKTLEVRAIKKEQNNWTAFPWAQDTSLDLTSKGKVKFCRNQSALLSSWSLSPEAVFLGSQHFKELLLQLLEPGWTLLWDQGLTTLDWEGWWVPRPTHGGERETISTCCCYTVITRMILH